LPQHLRAHSSTQLQGRMSGRTGQPDDPSDGDLFGPAGAREPYFVRNDSMASYVLVAIVIGLVIYLFYAVINPEKF
jgi:K+-transporting ATPase KdpF subunit